MNTQLSKMVPAHAIHPGEILLDELNVRSLSQADFADLIGMKKSQFNEIIKGKRSINAETALLLEKALKIDADFWLNLQKNYDLNLAKIENKVMARLQAMEEMEMLKEKIPFSFLKKQRILCGDPIEDVPKIKSVYGIKHLEDIAEPFSNSFYARFRKSGKLKTDPVNVIGWSKLVEYEASQINVSSFKLNLMDKLIAELKVIIKQNKKVQDRCRKALHENGIKLIYQETPEKCPLDGVSFWSNGNPAVGMSLRYKRLDNFTFTLFHELGHVFLHLTSNNDARFIDTFEDSKFNKLDEEIEADTFAMNQLIPETEWDKFISNEERMTDHFAIQFANENNIHPAIVKGRLKYHFGDYSIRTKIDNTLT